MAGIELHEVSKNYGSVAVIDRLSLSIADGEFVCFLGPSGCGKSTLLRMIAGLEAANGGQISIGGQRVDHLPPGVRDVSMVFQHYALYPHMTVFDNMAFGLRNTAVAKDEIESRITDAARTLEIGALLSRKPGQLSGGQRQRVAIGRALVRKPKAFLFDEPLSNLDAALRGRTRFELAQLHQRTGSTMVFVTHDQVEAMTLADRIVVMNNKRIEQVGSPMEIYGRPATKFVAEFVGAPPMNFLDAKLAASDRGGSWAILRDGTRLQVAVPFQELGEGTTFGIRAENLTRQSDGALKGSVQVVERLGERTLLHVTLMSGDLVVAGDVGASRAKVGDIVTLSPDPMYGHIFDASGRAYHPERVEAEDV